MKADPLRKILKGRVLIVGVGNPMRGDDGLGPLLIRGLAKRFHHLCIDAGDALERHIGRIVRHGPDALLLVDAVDLGSAPGAHAVLEPGELGEVGFSTHRLPLKMHLEELQQRLGGRIYLLAVQPRRLELGAGVCGPVRRCLNRLQKRIARALAAA